MYSSIIVCTIAKDPLRAARSSFVLGAESAGRERLDSELSCELYLRRGRVPMEVERAVVGGCYCVRSLALSLWIPSEEEEETKRFLLIFGGRPS